MDDGAHVGGVVSPCWRVLGETMVAGRSLSVGPIVVADDAETAMTRAAVAMGESFVAQEAYYLHGSKVHGGTGPNSVWTGLTRDLTEAP